MEATRSSETSAHTRSTRRHVPKVGILQYPTEVSTDCTFVITIVISTFLWHLYVPSTVDSDSNNRNIIIIIIIITHCFGDYDYLNVEPEAVRVNGICNMETVNTSVVMVVTRPSTGALSCAINTT
jgi:hypothetical protein